MVDRQQDIQKSREAFHAIRKNLAEQLKGLPPGKEYDDLREIEAMFIHAEDVAEDILGGLYHPIRSGAHIPGQFRSAKQVSGEKKSQP